MENLNNTPQVQDGTTGGAATPAAPTTSVEPVAPATPSTPSADAEAQKLAQLEQKLAKYESDIRALKSSSDKRYQDAQSQWKTQTDTLQRELERLRVASMDDDERKIYEANLAQERQQDAVRELEQVKQTAAEYQATMQALTYFTSNGVPHDKLILDQGYDALFNSGMNWLTEQVRKTTQQATPPQQQQSTTNLPNPPVVATNTGLPNTKPTWDDLRKKYGGDDEQIYRLVEAGLLPSDIIPT